MISGNHSAFINKRNNKDFYTGEAGENPMPEIVWLKDLYAPEINTQVDAMRETFKSGFDLVMIDPKSMTQVRAAVVEAKIILKKRLEAFR